MPRLRNLLYASFAATAIVFGQTAPAPNPKPARKAPAPADWAALGKLPDFTGVWEIPLGGPARGAPGRGAGRGRAMAPAPSLTPEYAAKAQEQARLAAKAEDNPS